MAKGKLHASVNMRALIQRINRKLAKDERLLKRSRGARTVQNLGDYYLIDVNRNLVVDHQVDPEALARELGVIAPWEKVENGE
jgi:hypothetical protein